MNDKLDVTCAAASILAISSSQESSRPQHLGNNARRQPSSLETVNPTRTALTGTDFVLITAIHDLKVHAQGQKASAKAG